MRRVDLIEIYGYGIIPITQKYLICADVARGDGTDYSRRHKYLIWRKWDKLRNIKVSWEQQNLVTFL